jgi:MFS family permease
VTGNALGPKRLALQAGSASLPRGFGALVAAQFASSLADNALLIVTIALLAQRGLPVWWAPLLKFGFTVSYVVLAQFVGPLADAMPKARLMSWMNGVKMLGVLGVLGLLLGLHPVAAFAIVGFGAAAYAPAKYGLTTELVAPERLVAANGWLEISVVMAVLSGTVLGGVLVGASLLESAPFAAARRVLDALPGVEPSMLAVSLCALLLVYATSALLNIGVPDSGARYPRCRVHAIALLREFRADNRALWRDGAGGASLAVTTIFWGVGATLQFAVLRWAADTLHLTLDRAAFLQVAVAVGVIAGAALAGRWVPLAATSRSGVTSSVVRPYLAGA